MLFYLKSLCIFKKLHFESRILKNHQEEVKINTSKEIIDYDFPNTPTYTPKINFMKITSKRKLRNSIISYK